MPRVPREGRARGHRSVPAQPCPPPGPCPRAVFAQRVRGTRTGCPRAGVTLPLCPRRLRSYPVYRRHSGGSPRPGTEPPPKNGTSCEPGAALGPSSRCGPQNRAVKKPQSPAGAQGGAGQPDRMEGGSGRCETPPAPPPQNAARPSPSRGSPPPPGTGRSRPAPAQPGLPDTRDTLTSPRGQGPHHGASGLGHSVGTRKVSSECVTRSPQPSLALGAEREGGTPHPPSGAGPHPPALPSPTPPLPAQVPGAPRLARPPSSPGDRGGCAGPRSHPRPGAVPGVTQAQPCERLRARRQESRDWSQLHPPDGTQLG
ncbi:proline-rich protein 2-like [Poecile atricapillus]|uniref:proline-rich protein 2-like n=1 Tax=Poecile atricapillus TaxID=48891 RepID=UPI00273939C5|nr:proline-rich protein 2-like [Poecile atricapillus]